MLETAMLETKSAHGRLKNASEKPARSDRQRRHARRYRPRRSTADRLREALLLLAGGHASVFKHDESAWSSITFTGTRHEVMLDFDGHEAALAGEEFIANLPDHEFRIPGQLVADANVREVDHRFGADERLVGTAVLLLLEEV